MSARRINVVDQNQGVRTTYGCDLKFKSAPITNLPAGTVAVRKRIRAHEMAQVFVKTADGAVTRYYAGPDGPGALRLLWPMGINKREARV